jgi:integrase
MRSCCTSAAAVSTFALAGKERELKREAPQDALTWPEAHRRWLEGNAGRFSEGHTENSRTTIRLWCQSFGAGSTIEGTPLAAFTEWVDDLAHAGKGRGAEIRRNHLLAIARWCRARGLVKEIPFEHSPKPPARIQPRRAATVEEFFNYAAVLPESMVYAWRLMGLTGIRLTAVLSLAESDIRPDGFTVLTKFQKRVSYSMTPQIQGIFDAARRFKAGLNLESHLLFVTDRGRPWRKDTFHKQLIKIGAAHCLPRITSHQLRHMAGTILAEENMSADIIKAGLAHETRASAESYIDQTQTMRDIALKTLDKKLTKNNPCFVQTGQNDVDSSKAKVSEKERIVCPIISAIFMKLKD